MQIAISVLLSLIILMLSVLHFYWALGGKWRLDEAVPTNYDGKKMLKTTVLSCIVVGTGLMAFSAFYFLPIVGIYLPNFLNFIGWLIPSIFLLRSIGDFKYVGFFKTVKTTRFGKLDTQYFSPLCLLLAVLGLSILVFG